MVGQAMSGKNHGLVSQLVVNQVAAILNPSRFLGFVRATTEITMVCLFLATILGLVSFDFTEEARIASHEFRFLGFGVLLSYSVDI